MNRVLSPECMFIRCLGEKVTGRGREEQNQRTETHGKFGPTLGQALSNLCPGIFAYMLK